jgi:glutamyl-Q tRNA(Asp) synthetase
MIVTRFAPSPTGYLHLGHAYAAFVAAELGERFLVRIEDIDEGRCRPEYEAAILEDLRWLGLSFEQPALRQSERHAAYREALDSLAARGLLYPCFCTRKEIAEEVARAGEAPHDIATRLGPDGPLYPGTCRALGESERARRIAAGEAYALRLDAAKAAALAGAMELAERGVRLPVNPLLFGDVMLARKGLAAAYHLAVVVDDAFQGVTLVTRGEDLFAASHVQRLLQTLLGLPAPVYLHHPLVLDETGKKFSKRDRAPTLRALRAAGSSPQEVHRRAYEAAVSMMSRR